MVESCNSIPRMYLDMNVWVSMTRGCVEGNARWAEARDGLIGAVKAGQIVVPLCAAHYLELWHRRDQRSREQVGALMRDVSGYATVSPPYLVRQLEVTGFIQRHFGEAINKPYVDDLVGHGASHAFNSPHGRFRFVQSLAVSDGSQHEGPPVPPPPGWLLSSLPLDQREWFQLVGTQDILDSDGVDRTPEHRYGSSQLTRELELRARLVNDPELVRRLWDLLVVEELEALLDDINDICDLLQVNPHALFFGHDLTASPPESMRAMVNALPSAYTWATLRYWKHRDLGHPWEQHDWTDISALSVAVPYCDAVVSERRWTHLVKASGLSERFSTEIGHGLSFLERLLSKYS